MFQLFNFHWLLLRACDDFRGFVLLWSSNSCCRILDVGNLFWGHHLNSLQSILYSFQSHWLSSAHWCGLFKSCVLCVRDLQLEYVDLFLIHWPLKLRKEAGFPPKEVDFLPLDIKSTWQAMELTVQGNFARAIGVSNFSSKKLESLLEYAVIKPAFDQVTNKHTHPLVLCRCFAFRKWCYFFCLRLWVSEYFRRQIVQRWVLPKLEWEYQSKRTKVVDTLTPHLLSLF